MAISIQYASGNTGTIEHTRMGNSILKNAVFEAVSFEAPDHTKIVANSALVVSNVCQRL